MDIYRSYFYYRSKKDDAPIEEAIRKAAEFGDGFDKIYQRLKRLVTSGTIRRYTGYTGRCTSTRDAVSRRDSLKG